MGAFNIVLFADRLEDLSVWIPASVMAFFGVTALLLSACNDVPPEDSRSAPEPAASVRAAVLEPGRDARGLPPVGQMPSATAAPTDSDPRLGGSPAIQGTATRESPGFMPPMATPSPASSRPAPESATPDSRAEVSKTYGIWPEVWSHNAPGVASYEFKINCSGPGTVDDRCFLSDLDAVTVQGPDGRTFALERDFNVNTYSGEVTRRWVLYGPDDGGLPPPGEYMFRYFRGGATVLEHSVRYAPVIIDYPRDVEWSRGGNDLRVTWTPPSGVTPGVYYKVILWAEFGTPDVLVSLVFPWDARAGTLPGVPLVAGGRYSLNVAIFFSDGYAHSDYVKLTW